MPRILIVEDEEKLRGTLERGLTEGGYQVLAVEDGETGLAAARTGGFDCLILDVMLPHLDGISLLTELRRTGLRTPVLMLTARGEVEDRVRGLDAGADDYLPKPFVWAELLARLRVCLRRTAAEDPSVLRAVGLDLDLIRRQLSAGSRCVDLTPRESELLEYLLRQGQRVVSREELAREVWHDPDAGLTNVIDVYINYLRKKLDRIGASAHIQTVRGVGYALRI